MSWWIQFRKALPGDIRTLRIARALRERHSLTSNALSVTLTLGCLSKLWMYADEHIADDDTLNVSLDDIDEIVGVQGFAEALPADWLKVLDAQRVELPDFIAHNGTSAKRRSQGAKRQATYRHTHRNAIVTRHSVTSNGARPDQNREDQTKNPPTPLAGLDQAAWKLWQNYRKLKPKSIELAQKRLLTFGSSQLAVVEQSIANGWQGLFELKTNGNKAEARLSANVAAAEEFLRNTEPPR